MRPPALPQGDRAHAAQPLHVYNGGFLTQRRVRRILTLAGYDIKLGWPRPGGMVGVWGTSPTAHRGEAMARKYNVPLLRVEDAFLRSLRPGRDGEPPRGLLLDRSGVHFDGAAPSDLETLLRDDPLDDTALLDRAREGIARLRDGHLSKYSGFDPAAPVPAPGYVLVVDQVRGDASIAGSGADANTFREMLYWAQEENPGARIVIKAHPEGAAGHRRGYFDDTVDEERISRLTAPVSPWALFDGAIAVYTVSSQLGFEAILVGHRPVVFGRPFYAGWGLTDDRVEIRRRARALTRAQLFAGAMIRYPTWYDPLRDRLCSFEDTVDGLEAEVRAWREDRSGWVATGMRLWKRPALRAFFGTAAIHFEDRPEQARRRAAKTGARRMVWAGRAGDDEDAVCVEDGFLRSQGLGADLVPPLSLVADDLGIYYDPTRPSRLEQLIAASVSLRPGQRARAEALVRELRRSGLTKYNVGGPVPDLPTGRRILVPGQVEDDASIIKGTGPIRRNLDLLRTVRDRHPDAILIYKPHPDVEAGLRPGSVPEAGEVADVVASRADPALLLDAVDEVATMTSLMGFEALLRGLPVTVFGAPFYAGWGLTRDLAPVPARRQARPGLHGLVHATLIAYPRYWDPIRRQPCPVEVVVERLASGALPRPGARNRILARAQGLLASQAWLWRR